MYAVIETGSKQYRVTKGDIITVEKLEGAEGKGVIFTQVLLIESDGKVTVGTPTVKGAKVTAEIIEQTKNDKVISFDYKRRKGYHRKVGHRQPVTNVKVTDIVVKGE